MSTLTFLLCQDTLNTNDKYFSIPLDFSRSSYAFSYGSQNKWELTFIFSVNSELAQTRLSSHYGQDYFSYNTYTNISEDDDAIYDWVATEGEVEFYSYKETSYKPSLNYSLSLGYKKLFPSVENDFNSTNFYIYPKISYSTTKRGSDYTITGYINIGYQDIDIIPDVPEEGDVYGEIYNEQIDRTILSTDTYIDKGYMYSIDVAIGHRYDIKHELFKIPKLFFGLDITYLTLKSKLSQLRRSRIIDVNDDVFVNDDVYNNDSSFIDDKKSHMIYIDGPEINLYLKYFF